MSRPRMSLADVADWSASWADRVILDGDQPHVHAAQQRADLLRALQVYIENSPSPQVRDYRGGAGDVAYAEKAENWINGLMLLTSGTK